MTSDVPREIRLDVRGGFIRDKVAVKRGTGARGRRDEEAGITLRGIGRGRWHHS